MSSSLLPLGLHRLPIRSFQPRRLLHVTCLPTSLSTTSLRRSSKPQAKPQAKPPNASTAKMRVTADLINNSLSYINPLKERELDLRGPQVS